ncbi:MAG: SDR family oxidoreductase, partial [Chloroflexi bacterium]|nr:SDR family oxidoreductase [Chloroflexota bacterium]
IARRLAVEGTHVALSDIDWEGVERAAEEINVEVGAGRCMAVALDVTNPEQVADAFRETVLAFGGVDILVSNAGIALTGTLEHLSLSDWQRSLDVNATGHLLVAQETVRIMREQGLGGSLVFVATKNVTAPGRGFGAYSAAKAAEAQLARVLAIENGSYGIRCNIINPDAVFQDSGLWSQELREERAQAHGIPVSGLEEFYRKRNLLQAYVAPGDVAEAALYLASDRSAKTTGCIITVDGGVPEAFPR